MPLTTLETTEAKIMKMRAIGYSQKEIANTLNITQSAVSQRISNIRRKAQSSGSDDDTFWKLLLGAGAALLFLKILDELGNGR
jgi:predicted transcriptional regulator